MKLMFYGFFTAFSLYSAIPMPRVKWEKDNMRYALCFFPLVGVIIAALLLFWFWLSRYFNFNSGLFAAIAVLIPVIVTGGIHIDGLVDTFDAVSSHALTEKKLEILKDPHVGAFGVIGCICYFILQYGLWQQLYNNAWLIALPALSCVVSRSLNGLSIATFPTARNSGLVHAFSSSASRLAVKISSMLFILGASIVILDVSILWGGIFLIVSTIYFFYHKKFCIWEFGGNTGDLAGFLLQNIELIALIIAVIGGVWRK